MPANSGYLYNWATAIAFSAGNYTGTDSQALTSGNAAYSVCPKGWRLPIGGANTDVNEFALVDKNSYGGSGGTQMSVPNQLAKWIASTGFYAVYAGRFFTGQSFDGAGQGANFWSSTALTSSNASMMYLVSSGSNIVSPPNNREKYQGSSLRCVFGG
jgi:uncharacterized protein (TIGR02145 family)